MKKMMIVTGSVGIGGIEKVTSRIANYYVEKGYNVTICCLLEGSSNTFVSMNEGIRVIYFADTEKIYETKLLMTRKWVKFIEKEFEEEQPDYVLAMTLKIGALCSLARKGKPIRISFRETSDPFSKVRNRLFDRLLCILCANIDGVIFQTQWEKKCYPKFIQKKGRVIPNPVSVDTYWDSASSKKTIVTFSRLINLQKRHDVLIEAFGKFHKSNPEYELLIYGNGPDYDEDVELINRLGLQNCIEIIPAKKDIHFHIKNASMFVMTSDFEGLSNALAEAMLMGLPCISSDWPGCNEVISHNVNGYIYVRQDIEKLSEYMDDLANNIDKRLAFSSEAMKLKEHFNPEMIMREYAKVIEGK